MREPLRVVVEEALRRAHHASGFGRTGPEPNRLERLAAETVRVARIAAGLHRSMAADRLRHANGPGWAVNDAVGRMGARPIEGARP